MEKLHLAIADQQPPFDARCHEFVWNDDFSAYRPVKLRWWDDASYIAYQCDEGDDYEPEGGDAPVVEVVPVVLDTDAHDDLPF